MSHASAELYTEFILFRITTPKLIRAPPPPLSSPKGGVAGRGQDTVKGAYWCLGRAQCMIWVYFTVHRDANYIGEVKMFTFLVFC